MDNIVLYDWFTMTSKIDSKESIISLIGLNNELIIWQSGNGRYGYRDKVFFDGITIYYNGRDDMGICLEMSGQGCRAFEEYGKGDWSILFYCLLEYPDDYNVTRLDVAFDDYTGLINIQNLARDVLQGNYVSTFKERSMGVYFSGKGTTVYMGSNTSLVMFRCYDKAAERNRQDEIEHWIRFEMQLRDERALKFISLNDLDIGEKFLGVINKYIRFVVPSKIDTNKRRWNVRKYWSKFCDTLLKIALYTPKNTDYNLARCEDYVYCQAGNALNALIKIKGLSTVAEELEERKPKQNIKYAELIASNVKYRDNPLVQAELKEMREQGIKIC